MIVSNKPSACKLNM